MSGDYSVWKVVVYAAIVFVEVCLELVIDEAPSEVVPNLLVVESPSEVVNDFSPSEVVSNLIVLLSEVEKEFCLLF